MIAVRVTWFVIAAAIALGVALIPRSSPHVEPTYVCIEPPSAQALIAKEVDELDALNLRLAEAVNAVLNAETDADRGAARAKLEELRSARYELNQRIAAMKAAVDKSERRKRVHISTACLENPLARGCN